MSRMVLLITTMFVSVPNITQSQSFLTDDEMHHAYYRQSGGLIPQLQGAYGYELDNKSSNNVQFGIEVPLYGVLSLASIPYDLKEEYDFSAKNGFSFSPGIGCALFINNAVMLKAGYQYWSKNWTLSYPYDFNNNEINVDEIGHFIYHGIYLAGSKEFKLGYIGAGLEFSFNKTYKFDIVLSDTTGKAQFNGLETGDVNQQVDLFVEGGLAFNFADKFRIKPGLKIGFPFMPLFDSGEFKFNIFLLRFGVSSEYFFTPIQN